MTPWAGWAAATAGTAVGSETTRLVVLRGNSASGKSTVAAEVRRRHGRGIALVGQDNLRRVVLRERDVPDGVNIGLIDTVARYALEHGYHVLVEGILYAAHYGPMLEALRRDHRGPTHHYYLDVSFDETLLRHAGKPQVAEYGEAELRGWYRPLDLLPGGVETVVPETSGSAETVERVLSDSGLGAAAS
ncbi:AAA family ATPase [Streptomyces sedi]|uniref:Kinase n=1 Tax=Streptomyces sedi TaxID=555059 RepID=A0A5C4V8Z1_9ACTN|nr:AAA family ATPase [Streptomyces sedi]TNM32241.1 kinase [Streptomyces sedi]